MQLVK